MEDERRGSAAVKADASWAAATVEERHLVDETTFLSASGNASRDIRRTVSPPATCAASSACAKGSSRSREWLCDLGPLQV